MILPPDPATGFDWSSHNTYSVNFLHRHSEQRADAALVQRHLDDPRRRLMMLADDRVLLRSGRIDFEGSAADALFGECETHIFLGLDLEDRPWFAGEFRSAPELEPGESLVDLRSLARDGMVGADSYGPAAQARATLFWHRRNRFCGVCGAPTVSIAAGYQRNCTGCGTQHFPRTDPVVIMLIEDGDDRVLLGRTPRFEAGMYTCLAGFMEPGETMEDAVRREVKEESGIDVGAVRYHASQPWPFPANLMLGCYGEAISTDIKVDKAEMDDCRWFGRDQVKAMLTETEVGKLHCPPPLAVARHLIEVWAGLK
ncbi:NAD(+) diphosphatase [Pleomorphomonas koreensis]|uniref:NAD(+) diphosphatase n=1 Tax=Pleomorphomonas koreensis TaxID=257440 RepID=UPI000406D79C|nr:NAD(+) diphosphatase [Pleomorphomonas koreensis]